MELSEQVYETLLILREAEYCLPWVEPIFIPGHPCFEAYSDMHKAYARLRTRLDAVDEDPDAEEMINQLLKHGKLIAMEMFRYGILYQKMQEEKPGA